MSRGPVVSSPILQPREDVDAFATMSRVLMASPAWRALKSIDKDLYCNLLSRHDGKNNGFIVLGSREAEESLQVSRPTVMAAFKRLEAHGVIVRRVMGAVPLDEEGKPVMSERMASEWELTDLHSWDLPVDDSERKSILAKRTFTDWDAKTKTIVPGSRPNDLPRPGTRLEPKPKPKDGRKPAAKAAPVKPDQPKPAPRPRRTAEDIKRQEAEWMARQKPPTQDASGQWRHCGVRIRPDEVDHYRRHPDDIPI